MVEETARMAKPEIGEIIAASLRTLAQFVPVVGGAAAQAWSEFEGILRNARIDEFFEQLKLRIEGLEEKAETMKERLENMPDFPRLLEDAVEAVRKESDQQKRSMFPAVIVRLILQAEETTVDERAYILEMLDSLSTQDLNVLKQFKFGHSRGDILTNTTQGAWAPMGQKAPFDRKYEELLSPVMISTAKLEARGILVAVPNRGAFQFSGNGGEWYDIYRERSWKLMPIGRKLLEMITDEQTRSR